MSDAKRALVVREWVETAEGDLQAVEALLTAPGVPVSAAAFHVQQCAEKYIKALLTAFGITVPKTHQIADLLALIPTDHRPAADPALVADLTVYAVAGRYPGRPSATLDEVRDAFEAVLVLRSWIRARLPAAALNEP